MSIFGRVADLFQATTHKLLTALEDPNETLELSYEKMIVGLQETKRHLADVVAQQQSLKRQIAAADSEIEQMEGDAREAVRSGRDDLARASLVHKQDALQKRATLEQALQAIEPQVEKLSDYERKLAARLERFRTQKDAMKSGFTAAKAQVKATESLTGLGNRLSGTGDALRRAEDKVHAMRDRADAMDGMLQSGQLADPLDTCNATQREIATMRATNAVDDELAALKAESPKSLEPPR